MPACPDLPCADCGQLMWRGRTSLPEGQARCLPCRRSNPQSKRAQREPIVVKECAVCSTAFETSRPTQVYCTPACRNRRTQGRPRHCEVCSVEYIPTYSKQRTCGRECGRVIHKPRPKTLKPPPSEVRCLVHFPTCGMCDEVFSARHGVTKYCSPACAAQAQYERSKTWACRLANKKPQPIATGLCECGQPLDHHLSPLCAKCRRGRRRLSDKRRAIKAGVEYEPVNRRKVYERDEWACHICGDGIDPDAAWPDFMCASIDHVVPLSQGGPHTYANIKAAHWLCNSYKRDDEQFTLRLSA